ncbi:MATE family efflux transporter [Paraneptunicella aestuarii]|uniref:MATE family efflux transporter n=1 Tax=Paraneptunicella aestuarii TaxID=2831148 RepID=UPI001E640764|nr:MATE family efflux transporter [Paraneptunicella aestuarii]UAA38876.1 MATE family efflux transporter [Paraneptunicella aestuarii]
MILSMQSRRIFSLAIPMIISNISTPLIGMVDTAVVGHMDNAGYLAGVALGSLILTQIYWICGFLRMSATGLSAEAKGMMDNGLAAQVWIQTVGLGLILGLMIVLLQWPLLSAGLWLSDANEGIQSAASEYFYIRVWSAPVALMNMAMIGWLVGQQQHKFIMWIQIIANILNAVLDLIFVYGLDLGVSGVALASVFAELSIFCLSILFVFRKQLLERAAIVWRLTAMKRLLSLNADMLVRNLALQLCLAFITYKGIALGDTIAATNAILMQFFVLIALGLDGLAYATEALIGEAKGQKNHSSIKATVFYGLVWSSVFALIYTLIFALFGEVIVVLLTDIPSLQASANEYFILVLLLPIVAHWCFLLDGVYIGLTNARVMRNSMLVCMLLFFFPTWFYLSVYENWGLWISFFVFLGLRGITLGGHLYWSLGKATS